jgi:hypothetical protein
MHATCSAQLFIIHPNNIRIILLFNNSFNCYDYTASIMDKRMPMEHCWMILIGESQNSRTECHRIHKKYMDWPGNEPRPLLETPAINRFFCFLYLYTYFFVLIVPALPFVLTVQHNTNIQAPAEVEPAGPASNRPQTLACWDNIHAPVGFEPATPASYRPQNPRLWPLGDWDRPDWAIARPRALKKGHNNRNIKVSGTRQMFTLEAGLIGQVHSRYSNEILHTAGFSSPRKILEETTGWWWWGR